MTIAVTQLIILLLFNLVFGIISFKLAKEKGRNVTLWAILGCIPVINYFCLGASNLRLEEKIDKLLNEDK